ncbi:hypothetical protein CAPTEDRAFT_187652, partial [Capitella teleta]
MAFSFPALMCIVSGYVLCFAVFLALMSLALISALVALFGYLGWFLSVAKKKEDNSSFMVYSINTSAIASIFTATINFSISSKKVSLAMESLPQSFVSMQHTTVSNVAVSVSSVSCASLIWPPDLVTRW